MAVGTRYTTIGMVAFVDLLGFSARVAGINTTEALEALEKDVRNVQRWFDHKNSDEVVRDVQRLQAKKVLAFSDCVVIAVPSYSELARSEGDFDVLLGEIVALAYAQGRCAVNGIFVRGGVDYGLWHKRKDTIISPAMVTAYNLERCAVVPMIAISDVLMQHFTEHPHRKFYHKSEDPVRRYFVQAKLPDGRLEWVLDYLPLFLGEVDGVLTVEEKEEYRLADGGGKERLRTLAWQRGLRELSVAHKEAILAARAAATNPRIIEKYEWLCRYHDQAMRRFFVAPPNEVLISATPSASTQAARTQRTRRPKPGGRKSA